MVDSEFLRYAVEREIATITIDRPAKRNAMTYAMLADFLALVGHGGSDEAARVVIVTGVPGAFCAGTDLADLATIPGADRGLRGEADQHDRWWPLVACPKPVIAAIDGPAVGMGAEFASQADVRIAVHPRPLRVELRPPRPRARHRCRDLAPASPCRSAAALRLLYSGEFVDAAEAERIGFVSQVVEPDDLADEARAEAERYLVGSPLSQRLIKALVYDGLGAEVGGHMGRHTQALASCFRSEDHKEGVAAFLERRPASFTGR